MMFFSKKPAQLSDEELVSRYFSTGGNEYIGGLFERYSHLVYGVCLKYLHERNDSQDAVLQIFENLFTELKKTEIRNFKSWIYSVTRHRCLMILRSRQRSKKREFEYILELALPDVSSELEIEDADYTMLVRIAMNELKEEQRVCLDLFYIQGKSYAEIIQITELGYDQVKSHIQNGKRNMKSIMEKHIVTKEL